MPLYRTVSDRGLWKKYAGTTPKHFHKPIYLEIHKDTPQVTYSQLNLQGVRYTDNSFKSASISTSYTPVKYKFKTSITALTSPSTFSDHDDEDRTSFESRSLTAFSNYSSPDKENPFISISNRSPEDVARLLRNQRPYYTSSPKEFRRVHCESSITNLSRRLSTMSLNNSSSLPENVIIPSFTTLPTVQHAEVVHLRQDSSSESSENSIESSSESESSSASSSSSSSSSRKKDFQDSPLKPIKKPGFFSSLFGSKKKKKKKTATVSPSVSSSSSPGRLVPNDVIELENEVFELEKNVSELEKNVSKLAKDVSDLENKTPLQNSCFENKDYFVSSNNGFSKPEDRVDNRVLRKGSQSSSSTPESSSPKFEDLEFHERVSKLDEQFESLELKRKEKQRASLTSHLYMNDSESQRTHKEYLGDNTQEIDIDAILGCEEKEEEKNIYEEDEEYNTNNSDTPNTTIVNTAIENTGLFSYERNSDERNSDEEAEFKNKRKNGFFRISLRKKSSRPKSAVLSKPTLTHESTNSLRGKKKTKSVSDFFSLTPKRNKKRISEFGGSSSEEKRGFSKSQIDESFSNEKNFNPSNQSSSLTFRPKSSTYTDLRDSFDRQLFRKSRVFSRGDKSISEHLDKNKRENPHQKEKQKEKEDEQEDENDMNNRQNSKRLGNKLVKRKVSTKKEIKVNQRDKEEDEMTRLSYEENLNFEDITNYKVKEKSNLSNFLETSKGSKRREKSQLEVKVVSSEYSFHTTINNNNNDINNEPHSTNNHYHLHTSLKNTEEEEEEEKNNKTTTLNRHSLKSSPNEMEFQREKSFSRVTDKQINDNFERDAIGTVVSGRQYGRRSGRFRKSIPDSFSPPYISPMNENESSLKSNEPLRSKGSLPRFGGAKRRQRKEVLGSVTPSPPRRKPSQNDSCKLQ